MKAEFEELSERIIPPEVQKELNDLDDEMAPQILGLQNTIKELESNIKERTLEEGKSVKGSILSAIFNKGRTKWDTKGLDGYAKSNPEILSFKKQGDPYIAIR